jgi:hypothetical protein
MPFPPNRYMAGGGGAVSFLLRQVITTGYVICGYNSGTPWSNVNQVTHSTDTTIDMGNVMVNSTGYPGGLADDTYAYALKLNGGVGGTGTAVGQYNMRTNTCVSFTGTPLTVGNTGTLMHKEQSFAYGMASGGTSGMLKFNFASKTWTNFGQSYGNTAGSGASTIYGELVGFNWGDGNSSSAGLKFTFATETQTSTSVCGAYGQQKGISSKLSYGYMGNEGDYAGGYNLRRYAFATDTNVGNVSKPIGNTGEENFDMGQDHQYMLGNYNGTQNNRSWRFNYTTDSGFEGSSTMQSKGVSGRSSAYSAQRS